MYYLQWCHLKEALNVLQDKDAAVGEVWLLWNLRTASPHRFFREGPLFAYLLLILASKIVTQSCGNLGTAASLERVEDENARPGNMLDELRSISIFYIISMTLK